MPAVRPRLDTREVAAFLRDHLGRPVGAVRALQGGEISSAFAYSMGAEQLVIRFGASAGPFHHDRYAGEHFGSSDIPIPPIHEIGRYGDGAFAISVFAPGVTYWHLPPAEQAAIAPALIEMLDRIHRQSIVATAGYGYLDGAGAGSFPAWPTFLRSIAEEDPDDFLGTWHRLFDESFLERPLFERLHGEMIALLPYLPDDRSLVHGDYGFDNVLIREGRISAVLDWANMLYGDFLYDVAWLTFWPSPTRYDDLCERHYADHGRPVPHFRERLRCYLCYIALQSLRFYAHTGQRDAYTWARGRVGALLGG